MDNLFPNIDKGVLTISFLVKVHPHIENLTQVYGKEVNGTYVYSLSDRYYKGLHVFYLLQKQKSRE
jgi:hypothetical protein